MYLVLSLKAGATALLEVGDRLPSGISGGTTVPMHQELPMASIEVSLDHL
jgi:hypothetical protein